MPVVSIVICTRNRAARLRSALERISKLDDKPDWECVVVDNSSTDETPAVIAAAARASPNIRAVAQARIGLGAARDKGWREARGDLIAFTDDDCYVAPDYVRQITAAFQEHPKAGCMGGRILLHDPDDAPVTIDVREAAVEYPPRSFIWAGALQGANLVFRRSVLEAIGGFDPELGAGTPFPCEDVDVVAAALWAGCTARFDPRIVVYHHHGRRETDIPALMAGYDRGRGAYYMKYILREDTRWAYLKSWLRIAPWYRQPGRVARELNSARLYLTVKKRRLLAVLLALASTLMIAASYALFAAASLAKATLQFTGVRQVRSRQAL